MSTMMCMALIELVRENEICVLSAPYKADHQLGMAMGRTVADESRLGLSPLAKRIVLVEQEHDAS